MFRKIIVGVDMAALEKGERIFRKAKSLLDDGGEIVLVNVIEDVPPYVAMELPPDIIEGAGTDARGRLKALVEKTGIAARVEVLTGSPARTILALADSTGADLIVIASHVPDFSNYFIGATADRIVRHARCSVLVDRGTP